MTNEKRWWLVAAAVAFQMSLGAAYAWSVFCTPLSEKFGWSLSQVAFAFTVSWFFLGTAAVCGGLWLRSTTPRVVAMTGGALWGIGVILASFAEHRLWWLYLTYGVIGGTGLGMGYIVPISFLVKWFPDRRGLMVGIAVGGFGSGALISAPIARQLIESVGVSTAFVYLGISYLTVAVVSAYFMEDPPEGWKPRHWSPSAQQNAQRVNRNYTLAEAIAQWQWWGLCALMSINTMAGLAIVSQAAQIFQEIGKANSTVAAALVGMVGVGNGLGRIFWAWVSDLTSRRVAFFFMYLIEAALFWTYHNISSLSTLGLVTVILVMCYGGGYAVTPAFAADYFGPANVGSIFGFMMLPWAFTSAIAPVLFAYLRQVTGSYTRGLHFIAWLMTAALVLPILVSRPRDIEGVDRVTHVH